MANIPRFTEIEDTKDLIKYLESTKRRQEIKSLHHYTSLDVAVKIIHEQHWHICSAKHMNDLLERDSGDPLRWKNKLFSRLSVEKSQEPQQKTPHTLCEAPDKVFFGTKEQAATLVAVKRRSGRGFTNPAVSGFVIKQNEAPKGPRSSCLP